MPQTSSLPPRCVWGPCRRWVRGSPRADTLWPRHGSRQWPPSPGPLCGLGPSWGRSTDTHVDIRTRAASLRPGGPCTPTFPETQGHQQCLPDGGTQLPWRRKFQAFPTSGTHSWGHVCPAQLQEPRGHAGGSEGFPGAGRGWAGPGPLCGAQGRDGEARRGSSSVRQAQAPGDLLATEAALAGAR